MIETKTVALGFPDHRPEQAKHLPGDYEGKKIIDPQISPMTQICFDKRAYSSDGVHLPF